MLARVNEFPDLHELTGDHPPHVEETDEQRAERHYRNSMAWAIVTGGVPGEASEETPNDG